MTKTKKIIIGIVVVVLIAGLAPFAYKWVRQKIEKVRIGLAEPNFPFRDYSQDELNKLYPQIKYADVPTRVTPEETYAKFRQALKENNLEMAVEQFSKSSDKRYREYVDTLTKFYKENKFGELYNNYYPERISKVYIDESIGQYEYDHMENGKVFLNSIDFTKDSNGDWKLDSL